MERKNQSNGFTQKSTKFLEKSFSENFCVFIRDEILRHFLFYLRSILFQEETVVFNYNCKPPTVHKIVNIISKGIFIK